MLLTLMKLLSIKAMFIIRKELIFLQKHFYRKVRVAEKALAEIYALQTCFRAALGLTI